MTHTDGPPIYERPASWVLTNSCLTSLSCMTSIIRLHHERRPTESTSWWSCISMNIISCIMIRRGTTLTGMIMIMIILLYHKSKYKSVFGGIEAVCLKTSVSADRPRPRIDMIIVSGTMIVEHGWYLTAESPGGARRPACGRGLPVLGHATRAPCEYINDVLF